MFSSFCQSLCTFSAKLARSWSFRLFVLCLLFIGLPFLAAAQEATIVGIVTDPSGAAIPNVTITITNTDTGLVTTSSTNEAGQYVAPNLRIGHYKVKATAPNFKAAEQKDIKLEVNDRRRVDFQLEVGATTETVTVEATQIAVQADSNDISTVVTGTQIAQLETNGRSLYELANLVPGASSAQADFQVPTPMGGDQTISFNGQRIAHALYMIDGGESADRGGSGSIVMPSIDSLSEFRVMTSNYSAEYGLVSGATISTALKAGTDKFHASAWWFGRNDDLDARNFFNPAPQHVQELRFNLWGFNVGGPVEFKSAHPKTFFFYNMEWRRQILGGGLNVAVPFTSTYGGNLADAVAFNAANGNALFSTGANFPFGVQAPYSCQVSAAVQAEFAAAGQAMSGCTGGAPNPALAQRFVYNGQQNVINPALINPNAALLLTAGIFPANASSTSDLFHGGQNAPTDVREEIVRIDHTFNSHWSIFGHFIDESLVNQTDVPARWAWVNLPTSSDTFGNPSYQAVVHVANTISPTLLNETAFNYGGNRINITPLGVFNIPSGYSEHRLFSGPNTILPQIFVVGKTGAVYNQNWSPWDNVANSYQFRDDLSWTRGKHQFKIGGGWLWFVKQQPLQDSPQGGFQFNGTYTGYDFADFLLGLSNSYGEAALKDTRHWNSVSWQSYIEDDWRATRRLTLNLGLRWDGIPHTAEVNGQQSNFYLNLWNAAGAAAAFAPGSGIGFVPGTNGNQICSAAGNGCTGPNPFLAAGPNPALNGLLSYDNGLGIACKNGISCGLVGNHWDTFGPRIGFAYDVTGKGKTIVRAGIGIFYERIQGNDMYQSGANNLFGGNPSISNVSLSDPHIGIGPSGATISAATLPVTVNGLTALNPDAYKIPTSTQYSAGVQQQLSARTVLSVAYVGNVGRHESYATEINMPALSQVTSPTFFWTNGTNNGSANLYRPYLGYGGIKMDENEANSNYNSLQVSLRSQIRDLTLQAAYTYAHANDAANNASNGGDGGDLDYVTNPYAGWKFDWGPSQYNRQNIAFVNFVYDVPFLRKNSNHFVRTVVGGWQVSGVVTLESGLPQTLTVGGGLQSVCTSVGTCGNIRPNLVGPITYPKTAATLTTGLGTMQWLSPSAFAPNLLPGNSSVATWGNLGYDGVWGPGRDNWNLALFKNFNFTERLRFEMRFESFNTFNHPQMNGFDLGVGDTDFGKINSAYDPRVFQLGAKLVF
ncbi:MAG TPA: carboxypeptidase-like regulatory domain-containing protein [Candidatus Acidoferrum sp.]|nr:carboxypeptidase-like regulatory domain-containing protein [Candidatus Acidoferrum sp.]